MAELEEEEDMPRRSKPRNTNEMVKKRLPSKNPTERRTQSHCMLTVTCMIILVSFLLPEQAASNLTPRALSPKRSLTGTRPGISDDEPNTQINLDPLQICLYPTFITFPEQTFQEDLRTAVKETVSASLREEFADRFQYFDFTDAQIIWYSGEETDPVCGDLKGVLPEASGRTNGQSQDFRNEPVPCTCALYPGAVVLVSMPSAEEVEEPQDGSAVPNMTIMEALIAGILEQELVEALKALEASSASKTTSPAYYELKAASVSWDAAIRLDGGQLVVAPVAQVAKPPTVPPLPFLLTESPTSSPGNTVAGLETGTQTQSTGKWITEEMGRIIGIAVACLVAFILIIFGWILLRRWRLKNTDEYRDNHGREGNGERRHPSDVEKAADVATVVGEDEDDDGNTKYERSTQRSGGDGGTNEEDGATLQTGDASEMAQYQQGELLECVSVASEWTLGTSEDNLSQDRSSITGNTVRLQKAAELLAANEAFERDRQITLQKDMLHSKWSSTPATAGMLSVSPMALGSASGGENALSFEQAYDPGQGEEIFLMPPSASRKPRGTGDSS